MWGCGADFQENLSSLGQLQSVVIVEVEWKFPRDRVIVPYTKWRRLVSRYPSNAGHEKSGMNLGRPLSKAKYSPMTDSELVP